MNDLIRQAIAAEAEEAVDSRTVLAELHKAKKRRKPFGLIVGVATLTVAAAAAAFIVPTALKKTEASPATSLSPLSAPVNVLFIGTDEGDNADGLVFARFNTDGTVDVTSLASLPKAASSTVLEYTPGPEWTKAIIERATGEKIDHYATIKMTDFAKLTNYIGGVEVCLSEPARDVHSGINLPAGRHVIQGEQALAYLRQRVGLPQGGVDRAQRHSTYLAGVISKITKDNAATLAREASKLIEVDKGWDVVEFAQHFKGPIRTRGALIMNPEPGKPYVSFVADGATGALRQPECGR